MKLQMEKKKNDKKIIIQKKLILYLRIFRYYGLVSILMDTGIRQYFGLFSGDTESSHLWQTKKRETRPTDSTVTYLKDEINSNLPSKKLCNKFT